MKQKGQVHFTGSTDGLCFYEMNGSYYIRRKSSLCGKRVKRDPKFALTMVYAGIMGRASKIASAVYRLIPVEERVHALYRTLTGAAMQLLKQGMEWDKVLATLKQEFLEAVAVERVAEGKDSGRQQAGGFHVKSGRKLRSIKHPRRIGIRVEGLHLQAKGLLRYVTPHSERLRRVEGNVMAGALQDG